MSECIPAKLKFKDKYATKVVGLSRCKDVMPPKPDDERRYIVRHLCENDSSMPNGFVCCNPEHVCWGTWSQNRLDDPKRHNPRQFRGPRNRRRGLVKYSDETKEKCRQAAIQGWEKRRAALREEGDP